MRVLSYVIAALLGMLGLLFMTAAGQGNAVMRIIIGGVCLIAAGTVVAMGKLRPVHTTHTHQLDLTGDVSMQAFKCESCGADLDGTAITMASGTALVHCPFCDAKYQLEEAPKW